MLIISLYNKIFIGFIFNHQVSLEDVFYAAKDKVPTLIGAKLTSTQLCDVQRCMEVFGGKYQILYGGDEVVCSK